jgi:hypothetical protein
MFDQVPGAVLAAPAPVAVSACSPRDGAGVWELAGSAALEQGYQDWMFAAMYGEAEADAEVEVEMETVVEAEVLPPGLIRDTVDLSGLSPVPPAAPPADTAPDAPCSSAPRGAAPGLSADLLARFQNVLMVASVANQAQAQRR